MISIDLEVFGRGNDIRTRIKNIDELSMRKKMSTKCLMKKLSSSLGSQATGDTLRGDIDKESIKEVIDSME